MKKTILFCLLFFASIFATAYSQTTNKSGIALNNVSLKEFFSTIEKQLGYTFMYSNLEIDDTQRISVQDDGDDIRKILNKAFEGKSIAYEISGKQIVLKNAKKNTPPQDSPKKKISGIVIDEKGDAVIGASVTVKGSTTGTITDLDGKFDLETNNNSTLQISYVGYLSQEVKVSNKTTFDIRLEEDTKTLQEVVVIGYGTLKRSDLTGAMASVDTKELTSKSTNNPAEALQGLVSGVTVQKTGGLAGSDVEVKIRGVNTFGNNAPLYIIDGFPGDIKTVNPNDIASMEVLKDGAAAAIYGSTAANGVIIVSTKNGKKGGATMVDINTFASFTNTANRLEVLDANGYVKVHRQMYENYNQYATNPVALPGYINNPGSANTNWQDEVFRSGLSLNQSVSVRGGMNETQFSVSANLTEEKGILIDNDFTKQNVRTKIQTKKNIFTIDANLAFTATKKHGPNFNLKEVYMISPLVPVYDEKEPGGYGLTNWGGIPNNVNVVAQENYIDSWSKTQSVSGNASVKADLTKWLNFRTSYSYQGINGQDYYHYPPFVSDPKTPREYAFYEESRSYWEQQVIDNILNFNNNFGKHSVNAMLGMSVTLENSNWNAIGVEGKTTIYSIKDGSLVTSEQAAGFLDPSFMTIDAGKGGTYSGSGSKYEYNRLSYFGRINYDFDNRYLLQFTIRRDGSSKFGAERRYGTFPSLALGWRISEENFFPKESIVSNLKLRASWGRLGNENALDYYGSQALISTYNSLWQGYVQGDGSNPWPGSIARTLENQDLRWETTDSKNIGFDYGLLRNKITGTINYYYNVTNDLLIKKKLAPSAGLEDPIMNVGEIRNSGFEFEFNFSDSYKDLQYNIGLNLSYLDNKVLKLADEDQILYGEGLKYGTEHFPTQTRQGYPIGAFFLYKTDGIFNSEQEVNAHSKDGKLIQPDAKPGDIRFVDKNGNGEIDEDDKEYCGSGIPKLEININLGASYKGFDISALIGSGWGHKLYNGNRYFYEGMNSGSNFLTSTLDAWTPDNKNTSIPRAVLQDPNGNTKESDRFLEKGDFIRLRQVQIGYTLPKNILRSIKSENLRIYASGENLLTWTKYTGIDPEFGRSTVLNAGIDNIIYPFTRSYVLGLQFTF